jgi:predicted transcriptional regulator
MPRKAQDVTDAELAILQVLWERGEATVRALVEKLYPSGTTSDLATVQKLLKRLEDKSCVHRNRNAWPHVFRPAIKRAELIGRRLQSTADSLCAGSLSPLLTHLVKSQTLSSSDVRELRTLLDDLDTELTQTSANI